MKVLVRSRYKEGMVATGRSFDRDGKSILTFRQFAPPHPKSTFGECYMTPKEASWVVEDKANQAHVLAGLEPEYYYPAGYPLPIADNAGNHVLQPPMTDASFHVSDARQTVGAQEFLAEQAAALARFKAEDAAIARGDEIVTNNIAEQTSPAPVASASDRAAAAFAAAMNRAAVIQPSL